MWSIVPAMMSGVSPYVVPLGFLNRFGKMAEIFVAGTSMVLENPLLYIELML
jgi:hypothetical protein